MSDGARGAYNLSDDRTMEAFLASIAAALGRPMLRLRLAEEPPCLAARILQLLPGSPLTESRVEALRRRTTYPSAYIEQEVGSKFRVSVEEGRGRLVGDWPRRG